MLSKFDYFKPETLEEALEFLENNEGTKVYAGGTDLMIELRHNTKVVDHILDIKGVSGFDRLEYKEGQGLFIGAAVNVNKVADSKVVREKYKGLAEAADTVASYQLRNRATLVGNICNASPGADLSTPLLVYEAKVHIAGPKGERQVEIHEFFKGVKKTVLEANEIVTGVSLPEVRKGDTSVYKKQSRLRGHDLATVGLSIRRRADGKVFLAMSAVAPTPIRLIELEDMVNDKDFNEETIQWLSKEVKNHIKPISDVRSSAEYRLHAAGALMKKGCMEIIEEGGNK